MAHTQRIKIMGLMRLTPEYGATSGPYEKGHQSCTNDGQLAGHPLMYWATYPNNDDDDDNDDGTPQTSRMFVLSTNHYNKYSCYET